MPRKTPVHSVVAVICDILDPLADEERLRALNAVLVSLGIARHQLQAADDGELTEAQVASIVQRMQQAAASVLSAQPAVPDLSEIINEFGTSLRPEQVQVLINNLDMSQKILFKEIMDQASPPVPGAHGDG